MLIALLTMMLLGGTPTAMLEEISGVQDSVKLLLPKGERQKAALDVLKSMDKRTADHNKTVDKTRKQFQDALSTHGFDDRSLDDMWGKYHETRAAYQKDMIDLRFELKDRVDRKEWEQIFNDD